MRGRNADIVRRNIELPACGFLLRHFADVNALEYAIQRLNIRRHVRRG